MSIPLATLPLELTADVQTPTGVRYGWGSNREAQARFKNLSFETAIGEGFASGGAQFSRPYNVDFPDIKLLHKVTFVGADGSVAYQGRISAIPREVGDSHSVGVSFAGLMANASDREFAMIYVDRDMAGWGEPSAQRRANLLAGNYMPVGGTLRNDAEVNVGPVLTTEITDSWVSPYLPVSESWYDAGAGLALGKMEYSWRRAGATGTVAPWQWSTILSTDALGASNDATGNLVAAGPNGGTLTATTSTRRFAMLQSYYGGTPAGSAGARYGLEWFKVAMYGTHGLTTYTGEPGEPSGVRSGDVLRHIIDNYCPQLYARNIAAPDYVIQHLAFKDGITPFEAMQQVNKYSLYNLAVWEDGAVDWTPFDLTGYDWQVRAGEDAAVSLQGPSTDSFYNGIVVRYDDVLTGVKNVLEPDTTLELSDPDPNNPWNQQGITRWAEIDLTYPHTAGGALQAGRAALADFNRAKSPGSITVNGYVRDRAGNKQPGWKVRAGDTVAVVNHPNDAPRLIHHTSWDDNAKTQTMSVDAPPSALDAQQDRVMTALKARGLLG
jgi:hypothetical protein